MKTDFRKWLPVIVMAVAVGGAFTTHAMSLNEQKATIVDGYIQLDPDDKTDCQVSNECTTINTGTQCTVDNDDQGAPLFGMEGNECIQPLYRP